MKRHIVYLFASLGALAVGSGCGSDVAVGTQVVVKQPPPESEAGANDEPSGGEVEAGPPTSVEPSGSALDGGAGDAGDNPSVSDASNDGDSGVDSGDDDDDDDDGDDVGDDGGDAG